LPDKRRCYRVFTPGRKSMPAYLTNSRRRSGLSRLRRVLLKRLPVRKLGAVRTIFLTRQHVFKLPGRWTWGHRGWWDSFLRGLLSNMQERHFAAEAWPELCPVLLSLPAGLMPRARPLTTAEWEGLDYRAFVTRGDPYIEENFDIHAGPWLQGEPGQPLACLALGNADTSSGLVPAEYKRDSFGMVNGRIVAADYG
jgi:hypothetical protein